MTKETGIRQALMAPGPAPFDCDKISASPHPGQGKHSPGTVQRLARCLCKAFSLEDRDITIDHPFAGGYITRSYGNQPLPGIQIEMNRGLYLSAPWFDAERLKVSPARLAELNRNFDRALDLFFSCQ